MKRSDLKKEIRSLGIKIYKNTKTQASFVRKGDVKKILADKDFEAFKTEVEKDFEPGVWDMSEDEYEEELRSSFDTGDTVKNTIDLLKELQEESELPRRRLTAGAKLKQTSAT